MGASKKNIAIIGPAYPLRGGGMATFNERMAREFLHQGHNVTIYTFSLQYPSFLFPGTTQYSKEAPPQDLKIEVLINSVNPLNWIKAGNIIRRARPDIAIVRYWLPFMAPALGTILRLVKKNKHTKIVCVADNVIPHEKRPGDNLFTKYFIPPIDAFITMSQNVRDDLAKFTTSKKAILVNHPLYDNFGEKIPQAEARQKLGIAENDFVLLFFGFIRKYKGLDILLDALPQISKNIPQLKLLVAGEFYGDKEEFDEQIKRLNISDKLILHTSFISDAEIKYFLCAADVVVQPYRNATQSGVSPLAYHFEIPMVVTNVGALPAMVPNNISGLVAEPNAASIADAVVNMHKLTPNSFLPGLRQEKEKYSWQVFTNAILDAAN